MRRAALLITVFSIISSSLFSIETGFYIPDRTNYETKEGTVYSESEGNAASNLYPVGTILEIKDKNGNSASVYVNDNIEMPPDRRILLNRKAASEIGLLDKGYDDYSVSVVLLGAVEDSKDGGWVKYLVAIEETNEQALLTYDELQKNGMKASANITPGGIEIYARYIPQYQSAQVKKSLSALGYPDAVQMDEENPYL